jgi:hypothetical protein
MPELLDVNISSGFVWSFDPFTDSLGVHQTRQPLLNCSTLTAISRSASTLSFPPLADLYVDLTFNASYIAAFAAFLQPLAP